MLIYTAQFYAAFSSEVAEDYQRLEHNNVCSLNQQILKFFSKTKRIFTSLHTIQLNHDFSYLEIREETLK